MKTDGSNSSSQNLYMKIQNNKKDEQNIQKRQFINQNQQHPKYLQYPQLQNYNNQNLSSGKVYVPPNSINNQPIYPIKPVFSNSPPLPVNPYNHPLTTQIIDVTTTTQDAICSAQMFPCQKCGLANTVGPMKFQSGAVAFAWGTCLLLFTGIFFFIPCTINKCKNAHVSCVRCGYKKAIVRPKCFC